MLREYLSSGPSVTERPATEAPIQNISAKRADVYVMLAQWQATFGNNAVIDGW